MIESGHIAPENFAAYAMRLLSPEEMAAIRTHLAACALCRDEMSESSGDLALLALSVEQQPLPAGAKERLLSRLASDDLSRRQATQALTAPGFAETARRRRAGWLPWVVAGALGITAIALGVQNHALNDELQGESRLVSNLAAKASRAQQVLEVLTAPAAEQVSLTPGKAPVEPSGRLSYLPDRGGLIFIGNNLQPLPADRTYELWIIPANGKPPIPAGLFRPDRRGAANVVLPSIPQNVAAKAFGVTVEKAGGSDVPTAPILLAGSTSGS